MATEHLEGKVSKKQEIVERIAVAFVENRKSSLRIFELQSAPPQLFGVPATVCGPPAQTSMAEHWVHVCNSVDLRRHQPFRKSPFTDC